MSSINDPATFLELVQRTRRECQVEGSGPSAVSTATGIESDLVGWVAEACREIQKLHQDWQFLRASTSWLTKSGQAIYTPTQCGIPSGKISYWERHTFRNFHTATGPSSAIHMSELSYNSWRDQYFFGSQLDVRTRPTSFAIDPVGKGVCLGPLANADYTITADYFSGPIVLTDDSDVPVIPNDHIMTIVYKAMMAYGEAENATEIYHRGSKQYAKAITDLEIAYLPPTCNAGALA